MGTYRLTAHSFVVIRFIVGLNVFTLGALLNNDILSTPVTVGHYMDSSTVG